MSAALSTRGLDKSFGSLVVAKDIAIALPQGARYALIGPNGAGKTTLINLMTGMLRPDAGEILLGDETITALHAGAARQPRAGAHLPDQHAVPQSQRARGRDARGLRARGRRAHLVAAASRAYRDAVDEAYAILVVAAARHRLLSRDARAALRPAAPAGDRAGARHPAEGAAARRARRRRAARRERRAVRGHRRPVARHHGAVHRARHELRVPLRQPHHRDGRRPHPARGHAGRDRRRSARARGLSRRRATRARHG